jgi:hypothetical protein
MRNSTPALLSLIEPEAGTQGRTSRDGDSLSVNNVR